MTHPHPKKGFIPQAVLTRTGKINTAGKNVNTAGASINTGLRTINTALSTLIVNHPRPKLNAFKSGYSQSSRTFNRYYANKNSTINTNINTARIKNTTARDRAVGNPQQKEYKEKAVIDSGCSRHMTGNKCYLSEYEDCDGGFVSFGDGKGRISGKSLNYLDGHLNLEDSDGIPTLPNAEFFEQLAFMGNNIFTHHYQPKNPSISQQLPTPPFMQTIHDAEEPVIMPHDSSHLRVQSLGSDEGSLTLNDLTVLCTTLSKKKLEHKVKASKSRRRARVIISNNEEDLEDSYKQGRIIAEIDQNPSISFADTEILLEQEEPIELVEDPSSGKKGEKEISTAEVLVSTASVIPEVSTAIPERQVYIRRSAKKRKDKGKVIMKDDESIQKKTKKQLEQERLGYEEAIRLQEQINEEERQRIARDAKIAKQLQEEFDIARGPRNKDSYESNTSLGIAKGDSEIEKEVMKRSGFDFQKPPVKRQKVGEVSGSAEEQSAEKEKEVSEEDLKKLLVIVPVEKCTLIAYSFKQEPYETLFQAWEQFKELLVKCPQYYLTEMQEVIFFYNGLDILTRQILDSRGVIPTKTVGDAKKVIHEMAEYSQKWHNGTSRGRSTKTSDGLAAIQAQLNNLGREIKKVNEKVYVAQVGCEQCKGPHYTKDYLLKEEGKTLEEAYYTQFGGPF
ncbi:hypothetical protein Tco_1465590 [Tanacetum coccineum]